jgi:hypothetical protein
MKLKLHYYQNMFEVKAAFNMHDMRGMRSHGAWSGGYEIFAAMHLQCRCVFAGVEPMELALKHRNFDLHGRTHVGGWHNAMKLTLNL